MSDYVSYYGFISVISILSFIGVCFLLCCCGCVFNRCCEYYENRQHQLRVSANIQV